MALKAHLFGWTIIQKGLTSTQSLSKFISMLLLNVLLLKLSTGGMGILMSCKLEKGHSPNPLRTSGVFRAILLPMPFYSHNLMLQSVPPSRASGIPFSLSLKRRQKKTAPIGS